LLLIAHKLKLRHGHVEFCTSLAALVAVNTQHLVWVFEWILGQKRRLQNGENCRVCANTEGQSKDRNPTEARVFPEYSQPKTQVLPQIF
jgi:hypothetical protein